MANQFVRAIPKINVIDHQPKHTNVTGDLLINKAHDAYINADGEYKPITFPIHQSDGQNEKNVVDVVVDPTQSTNHAQHGDEFQTVVVSDNPVVSMSDKVREAWQTELDAFLKHGKDQVIENEFTAKGQIHGKIDDSDHADVASKVEHTLTVKQDGEDDVTFDGSADKVVEIKAGNGGGASWVHIADDLAQTDDVFINGQFDKTMDDLGNTPIIANISVEVKKDVTNPDYKINTNNINMPYFPVPLRLVDTNNKVFYDGIYDGMTVSIIGDLKAGTTLYTTISSIQTIALG